MIKPAPRGSDPETIRAEILEKLAYSIGKDPAVAKRHDWLNATILALHAEAALERRLLALGLRPGQAVHLLRRGLMNGPLHIRVGTTELMLRRQEAQHIDIRPNRRPNPIRGTGA